MIILVSILCLVKFDIYNSRNDIYIYISISRSDIFVAMINLFIDSSLFLNCYLYQYVRVLWSCLSLLFVFGLVCSVWNNIAIPACLQALVACSITFYSFTFSLCASYGMRSVYCRKQVVGFYFPTLSPRLSSDWGVKTTDIKTYYCKVKTEFYYWSISCADFSFLYIR